MTQNLAGTEAPSGTQPAEAPAPSHERPQTRRIPIRLVLPRSAKSELSHAVSLQSYVKCSNAQ